MYMCSSGWILTGSNVRATGYVASDDIARSPHKERAKHVLLSMLRSFLLMHTCLCYFVLYDKQYQRAQGLWHPQEALLPRASGSGTSCRCQVYFFITTAILCSVRRRLPLV